MGLFGRKTWSEKIAKAFNTFNDEAKPLLFPKGAAEAEEVASAIANCCGVDVAKCNQKQAEELLNIYAEVAAGKLISNQPRDVIVANLLKNYEKTIRSAGMADRICNYCEKVLSKGDAEVEPEAPVIFDEEPAEEPAEEVAEEEPAEEVAEGVAEEAAEEEPEAEEEETEEEEAEVTEEVAEEEEPSDEEPAEEAAEEVAKEIPEAVQAARKGLKKLVKKFELDGKGRKAMADAMKDTRKSLVKGVMKECGEDGATAVKAAFCAAMAATEAYKVDDKVFEESEKSAWKVLKKDLGMNPERLIFQAESDEETAELLTALVKKTGAEGWADMSEDVRKDVLKAVCTVGFKKAAK